LEEKASEISSGKTLCSPTFENSHKVETICLRIYFNRDCSDLAEFRQVMQMAIIALLEASCQYSVSLAVYPQFSNGQQQDSSKFSGRLS